MRSLCGGWSSACASGTVSVVGGSAQPHTSNARNMNAVRTCVTVHDQRQVAAIATHRAYPSRAKSRAAPRGRVNHDATPWVLSPAIQNRQKMGCEVIWWTAHDRAGIPGKSRHRRRSPTLSPWDVARWSTWSMGSVHSQRSAAARHLLGMIAVAIIRTGVARAVDEFLHLRSTSRHWAAAC